MTLVTNVHVIVRHVGERTKELCSERLQQQVDTVEFVSCTPFSQTVKTCFERAITANKKWTVCVDADVVPSDNCIKKLVDIAEQGPATLFEAQGLVADKVFGVLRPAGNHIYRTSLLPTALQHLAENAGSLRPESGVVWSMARQEACPWWQDQAFIGLHDHGQFYGDLIRKVLVQFFKFPAQRPDMEKQFMAKAQKGDRDYAAAVEAVRYAQSMLQEPIPLDAEWMQQHVRSIVDACGIVEKDGLASAETATLISALEKVSAQSVTERDMQFIGQLGLRQ